MFWRIPTLKETATLKASESEMQALIKSCNLPQTRSKSNKKLNHAICHKPDQNRTRK